MDVAGPVGLRSWHEMIRDTLKENDVRLIHLCAGQRPQSR